MAIRKRDTLANWTGAERAAVTSRDPLTRLTIEAKTVLYSVSSVFPFDLFPDSLVIHPYHIDIIHRIFFMTGTSERLMIADIQDTAIHYGPFFAAIEVVPKPQAQRPIHIGYLWKYQALRARRILEGLCECTVKHVDIIRYNERDLLVYLEEIGKSREVL